MGASLDVAVPTLVPHIKDRIMTIDDFLLVIDRSYLAAFQRY